VNSFVTSPDWKISSNPSFQLPEFPLPFSPCVTNHGHITQQFTNLYYLTSNILPKQRISSIIMPKQKTKQATQPATSEEGRPPILIIPTMKSLKKEHGNNTGALEDAILDILDELDGQFHAQPKTTLQAMLKLVGDPTNHTHLEMGRSLWTDEAAMKHSFPGYEESLQNQVSFVRMSFIKLTMYDFFFKYSFFSSNILHPDEHLIS
jgi:hypothetical protein